MPEENIDDEWGNGNTALHAASFMGESEYINELIGLGADSSIQNGLGLSPVDVALDNETRDLFAALAGKTVSQKSKRDPEESSMRSISEFKTRKSLGRTEVFFFI